MLVLGAVVYIAMPIWVLYLHRDTSSTSHPNTALGAVRIDGADGRWAEWKREDAIKFSFDELDAQITLYMTGAAAVVAGVAKITLDAISNDPTRRRPMSRGNVVVAAVICAFCGWSLFFGVQAKALFPRVAEFERFSLYGDLGAFAIQQIVWFFAALGVLVSALLFGAWRNAVNARIQPREAT
jgi:hypothetical protein